MKIRILWGVVFVIAVYLLFTDFFVFGAIFAGFGIGGMLWGDGE